MARYHFNPETGKASACRAKPGNCPFLTAGSQHFDTLEEARAGVERYFTEEYASNVARYAILYNRIQHRILELREDLPWSEIEPYINERHALDLFIKDMEPEDFLEREAPKLAPQRILAGPLNADDGAHVIVGIGNDVQKFRGRDEETLTKAIKLSEDWFTYLNSEEAKAVLDYSGDPLSCIDRTAIIDQAIAKAPRLEPTTVYSGLGKYVANDVLSQLESGRVKLDYHISTSLNAGQVNGFMEHIGSDADRLAKGEATLIAVEIETTVGGSMMAVSHSLHEFEVLLPSGEYEVIGVRENVETLWNEGGPGRKASKLIKLRRLES